MFTSNNIIYLRLPHLYYKRIFFLFQTTSKRNIVPTVFYAIYLQPSVKHIRDGLHIQSRILSRNLFDGRRHNADISSEFANQSGNLLSITENFNALGVRVVTHTKRTLYALRESPGRRKTQEERSIIINVIGFFMLKTVFITL